MPQFPTAVRRWTFELQTPLGATRCSYEVTDEALLFDSDDPFAGGGEAVRWDSIAKGSTAAMAGMGGRGGPDLPVWVPEQLEWLTLSRVGAVDAGFMRTLPQEKEQRDAIVAAVRDRLGPRWIGECLPLKDAQQRLGISSKEWSGLKVFGLVLAVLALLALSVLAAAFLFIPAALLIGGWMLRQGLYGWRDSIGAASVPLEGAGRMRPGLIRLEGRATTPLPSIAPLSGRSCVWWDAAVWLWYEGDSSRAGEWRQMAARFGGARDTLEIRTDDSGRLPVWLKDVELLLEQRSWDSRKDELPAQAAAWLRDQLGFAWSGGQHLKVTEEGMADGATVHVLGTLAERRNLREAADAGAWERMRNALQTGQWRRGVTTAMPRPLRPVVAVFIGYLDLLIGLGSSRGRPRQTVAGAMPPAIPPDARLIWKGRGGRPLLVSDQPLSDALATLRQRSLIQGGIGAAIFCFSVYTLIDGFKSG